MHVVAKKKTKHKSSSLRQNLPRFSERALIDILSWYVLFSQCRSSDNTPENCFFQILSYSPAYVGINCEKTKGEVPSGPLLGKQNI